MRRMNRKTLALVLMGTLSMGGVALAGEGRKLPPEVLQKYDTNKNGQLDDVERQNFKADREKKRADKLAKFDTNKDGSLDETERKALHAAKAEKRFKALDTNGNGTLSIEEFTAGAGKKGHGKGKRGHR